jgi:hypothetical protein
MVTERTMIKNILATYALATPTIIEDGTLWYATGNAIISDIAANTGYSVERVATVMAHLSPRTMWSRNVLACERVCQDFDKPSGIMGRNWDMAYNALRSDNPLATLNGDKVKRFAANLLGDTESVTVDIWAVRCAAGAKWETVNLKHKGVYSAIERAYQKAATKLGIEPAHLQAITWIVVRNGRSA